MKWRGETELQFSGQFSSNFIIVLCFLEWERNDQTDIMLPDESRSSLLGSSGSGGRQSSSLATPPRIGSSRVKSPLPAPAAYRSSCMSAAAKRYKVMIDLYNPNQWSKVWVTRIWFSVLEEDIPLQTDGLWICHLANALSFLQTSECLQKLSIQKGWVWE